MDLDVVLLNVQERDKWRLRVERLSTDLAETRKMRRKLAGRLRRINREIEKLRTFSEALLDLQTSRPSTSSIHASHDLRRATR